MENECKGCKCCHSYNLPDEISACSVGIAPVMTDGLEKCPCINCIVKVVCVSACEAFQVYTHMYKFGSIPNLKIKKERNAQ